MVQKLILKINSERELNKLSNIKLCGNNILIFSDHSENVFRKSINVFVPMWFNYTPNITEYPGYKGLYIGHKDLDFEFTCETLYPAEQIFLEIILMDCKSKEIKTDIIKNEE